MPEKLSRTYKADRRAAQFTRDGHRILPIVTKKWSIILLCDNILYNPVKLKHGFYNFKDFSHLWI